LALTNNHVVQGAVDIRVRLEDGRAFDAEVLGRDPLTDVALIRFKDKGENLPVASLGDSDAMRVGDWVVAIGNPFGLASSVSAGIISARARDIQAGPYDDFLQTDAAINPGNSGGPLFNMRGQVIGINTAIVGGGTGIGFAVPSNMAKALLPQLEKGKIRRGWLGVGIQDLTPELAKAFNVPVSKGALVTEVNEGTPARKAGLRQDDVIVAVDGQPMDSSRALGRAIGFKQPGASVALTVYRGGKKEEVKAVLGAIPDQGGDKEETATDEPRSGKLGLKIADVDPRMMPGVTGGAVIADVTPGSPADHADLRPGMIVVEAGGKPINSARDLVKVLQSARSGSTLVLRIQLEGGRIVRALSIP
jgi:serine protease Do